MRELALFAGAGGGLLGSRLLEWRTACAVELDAHCRDVLLARQRDGCLDRFPIWDDVRTFDGRPWRGAIDVVSGGFPCQDISSAGRGAGLTGDRSGLWFEMLRIISEVQPAHVFAENSPNLRTRGLGTVLEGLTGLGYDCRWGVLGAWHIGAPHRRNRMWIVGRHTGRVGHAPPERAKLGRPAGDAVAKPAGIGRGSGGSGRPAASVEGQPQPQRAVPTANAACEPVRFQPRGRLGSNGQDPTGPGHPDWWTVDRFAGVDDGLADRMERVRATGNGQVPGVAALAWRVLTS